MEANSKIGMGHLIRCSALAEILCKDFDITFFTLDTHAELINKFLAKEFKKQTLKSEEEFLKALNKSDIVVLDGYEFDSAYQSKIKSIGCKLVYIDDLMKEGNKADLIINQAEGIKRENYKSASASVYCLGSQYALLRKPFLQSASEPQRQFEKINTAFVSFGGADSDNVSEKVLKVLLQFNEWENIYLLSGPVNENVKDWKSRYLNDKRVTFVNGLTAEEICSLLHKCHLGICPSSSLSLEICAVGMVMLTGTTAANQNGYYEALICNSVALGVGIWQKASEQEIGDKIRGILRYDSKDIEFFTGNQKQYIDGKSGWRLQKAFMKL